MLPLKHILVATDFSSTSEKALEAAIELARALSARLTLVHVFEIPKYHVGPETPLALDVWDAAHNDARDALKSLIARVQARVPDATAFLREGIPSAEILDLAAGIRAELLVMGTHGRRGLAHMLLGSVAERVVRMSPVPVLTVGGGGETAPQLRPPPTEAHPEIGAV